MRTRTFIFIFAVGILIKAPKVDASEPRHISTDPSTQQSPDVRDGQSVRGDRQIAQLTKKLKLRGQQKKRVLAILQERNRDIELIQESSGLSNQAKATRIARIVAEYNARIEDFLNDKQRYKFEQVLMRQRQREENNRQTFLELDLFAVPVTPRHLES